ncbi:MAG: Wzz/FepE/Etk N-terminal domain-containing protein, partial [Phycisphaerae bacterium]|nr:Wzz/FepE/Etk N-terminal domain-containing protein [Phycisphaerae bacterium]
MNFPSVFSGGDSSPVKVIWRRRGLVLACGVIGLIAGGIYVLGAQRTYTITSKVMVRQASVRTDDPAANAPAGG